MKKDTFTYEELLLELPIPPIQQKPPAYVYEELFLELPLPAPENKAPKPEIEEGKTSFEVDFVVYSFV